MKVIKAGFTIEDDINPEKILKNVEKAGRTCYKSEDRITEDSAKVFIKRIIESGHESVIEHEKITVRFICDRGVTHELVRHRLASYSQESTRYCNYSKDKYDNQITFIKPVFWDEGSANYKAWENACIEAEKAYIILMENGATPQEARSVLPNSLKTEIVATANLREWRTILKQRTSNKAHPQIQEVMRPLLDKLKQLLPPVFEDINY